MKMPTLKILPVAVIGAGPVGLAAAAHLIARGLPVKVYEAGPAVGCELARLGPCPRLHAVALLRRCGGDGAARTPRLAIAAG